MEHLRPLAHIISQEEHALQSLHRWLRYEGLLGLFGGAAFFLPFGLFFSVLVALAAVFIPYMFWKLYMAGWYKSIAVFVILVLLPLSMSWFVEKASLGWYLLMVGPLVFFYLYTWGLHHMIGEHLSEVQAVREWEDDRRQRGV